jgi:LDH2 family malate/lactate/ureidoglycolate dehydrogenase
MEHAIHILVPALTELIERLLEQAGADEPSRAAVTRSVIEASTRGVDTHGVILVPHYLKALLGGRINGSPRLQFAKKTPVAGYLDADNGFGHLAGYEAVAHAVHMARYAGLGAVTVGNSSHFGAAASYTLAAARQGLIGLAASHSDAVVVPHKGLSRFNGTNPIAFAAPVPGDAPLSIDLATSAVAWNRLVLLSQMHQPIPADVVVDAEGGDTTDPAQAAALLPLGGRAHGHKGAALASMVEVLSSTLTGMTHGHRLISMEAADMSTPRRLGHFFLVLDPAAFVSRKAYDAAMADYLADLRSQPGIGDETVVAPGDNEVREAARRERTGIPISEETWHDLATLAVRLGVPMPARQRSAVPSR